MTNKINLYAARRLASQDKLVTHWQFSDYLALPLGAVAAGGIDREATWGQPRTRRAAAAGAGAGRSEP